ncbi:MAG: oligosaccharide flippase family protein [Saprospirales bacterium]|nr:oligosaccharide flippase family protein [Saprospirales bacterium]
MAIAWGFFFRSIVTSIFSWWFGRKDSPSFTVQLLPIRSMLRFGIFEAGNNLVFVMSSIIDKAIIGRYLGAYYLGLYAIAWELAMAPVSRINPLVTRVAYPVFSSVQDQSQKLNAFLQKIIQAVMSINIPILLALGIFSAPILTILFGSQWVAAATCLSILSLLGLGRAINNLGAGVFLAQGRSDLNFAWNLSVTVIIALLLISFFQFFPSLETAAIVQVIAFWSLLGFWFRLLWKKGGISIHPLLKILTRRILVALPFAAVLYLSTFLNMPALQKIIVGFSSSFLIYIVSLIWLDRPLMMELRSLLTFK